MRPRAKVCFLWRARTGTMACACKRRSCFLCAGDAMHMPPSCAAAAGAAQSAAAAVVQLRALQSLVLLSRLLPLVQGGAVPVLEGEALHTYTTRSTYVVPLQRRSSAAESAVAAESTHTSCCWMHCNR
eukprot:1153154-Pelagomonas_calceolata.AAC.5